MRGPEYHIPKHMRPVRVASMKAYREAHKEELIAYRKEYNRRPYVEAKRIARQQAEDEELFGRLLTEE